MGAAITIAYVLAQGRGGGDTNQPVIQIFAAVLIAAGLILMVLAVIEMRKHRTTVIPHLQAYHLVQSGVFKYSHNPIYLGDVLVLAGVILRWDVILALPLIPALVWTLRTRFILPEEGRLRQKFGANFEHYTYTTRRWA